MTERLFETDTFWEETFPDNDRGRKIKRFVEAVTKGVERIEKVLLIRYGETNERLFLFLNPPVPTVTEEGEPLGEIARLSGPRTLNKVPGIVMTRQEMNCITDSMNDSFRELGKHIREWPWAFEFTQELYEKELAESKELREAQKFVLWEKEKETAQA